jgi:hydroxymethylglutaryl-CoA reductase
MADGSRIRGFYKLPLADRRAELSRRANLASEDEAILQSGGIAVADADRLVENVVGIYNLPLALGLNFQINGRDVLVPMAVEEPSVVAAASNAARMVRAGGGFTTRADEPIMTAQIEIIGLTDPLLARVRVEAEAASILARANALVPRLVERGGGAREMEARVVGEGQGRLVVHVHVDCRDAMGANLINTIAEQLAPNLAEITGGRIGLRILTNLADRRLVHVTARVPFAALAADNANSEEGARVADGIAAASRFAEADPYRAATHNKGVMNGVDAVVIATGNDWRGVEAGAHAYAARTGQYQPLSLWHMEDGHLVGQLAMPMAVGTVGGTLQLHPAARLALKILNVRSAGELGMIIGAVGLGQNLAALRALATEGIQRGHMALHRQAVSGRREGQP